VGYDGAALGTRDFGVGSGACAAVVPLRAQADRWQLPCTAWLAAYLSGIDIKPVATNIDVSGDANLTGLFLTAQARVTKAARAPSSLCLLTGADRISTSTTAGVLSVCSPSSRATFGRQGSGAAAVPL
jgi:hypothetical protein